jgi:hypothetical protein
MAVLDASQDGRSAGEGMSMELLWLGVAALLFASGYQLGRFVEHRRSVETFRAIQQWVSKTNSHIEMAE